MKPRAKRWLRALLVSACTVFVALLVFNLSLGDKQIDRPIQGFHSTHDPQFVRTMGVLLGPDLVSGNKVEELINGDRIFPAMLDAMRSARHSITLESYIFFSGRIAREFVDVLSQRARAGVKVLVLLDWVGGQIDAAQLQRLRESGVQVRRYHAPRWYNLQRLNNRTHRKLLVVDGLTGFTGGVGIADKWRGDARGPNEWRDTHFLVTGPVVAQMQATFADNWIEATGEALHGEAFFPEQQKGEGVRAHMFSASPGGGAQSMQLLYLMSIAAAAKTIDLSASYFVPDEAAIAELAAAARRGVRLRILVPGENIDWNVVRRASRSRWGPLLAAGAEIYEYQQTMYHVKMMIVDGVWVTVGSTNFDPRSFAINDEANLDVFDPGFANRQTAVFEADLMRAKKIGLDDWRNRSWQDKVLDRAAGLLGSQL
jgi:cardiolipin synthase